MSYRLPWLSSSARIAAIASVGERDQHLHGTAGVVEAHSAEVASPLSGEVVLVRGWCSWCGWGHGWASPAGPV